MSQKNKTILKSFLLLALFAISIKAFAIWTDNSSTPPDNNTSAPINVSVNPQQKNGALGVDGFRSFGPAVFDTYIKIGSATDNTCQSTTTLGAIRYNNNNIEYCADNNDGGAVWSNVSSGGTGTSSPWDSTVGGIKYVGGKVGIGVAAPTAKLEVAGQIKITGGSPGLNKVLTSDASGLASWQSPTASAWTTANGSINYVGGNVGIGTSTPTSMLDVNGSVVLKKLRFEEALSANYIQSFATRTQGSWQPLYFGPYDSLVTGAKMVIDGTGNVGIGTATPITKLVINGGVDGTTASSGLGIRSGDVWTTIRNMPSTNNAVIDVTRLGTETSIGTSGYNLVLNPSGGNVGIGTGTPSAPFFISQPSVYGSLGLNVNEFQTVMEDPSFSGRRLYLGSGQSQYISATNNLFIQSLGGVIIRSAGLDLRNNNILFPSDIKIGSPYNDQMNANIGLKVDYIITGNGSTNAEIAINDLVTNTKPFSIFADRLGTVNPVVGIKSPNGIDIGSPLRARGFYGYDNLNNLILSLENGQLDVAGTIRVNELKASGLVDLLGIRFIRQDTCVSTGTIPRVGNETRKGYKKNNGETNWCTWDTSAQSCGGSNWDACNVYGDLAP